MEINPSNSIFVFPGQGSQFTGMGKDLNEINHPLAIINKAEKILDISLSEIFSESNPEILNNTRIAQPAIMLISLAYFELVKHYNEKQFREPKFWAGHSLGEYTALVASNTITLEEGLNLISKRALFMEQASKQFPGGMIAVIGLELNQIENVLKETSAEIANINSKNQIVISCKNNTIEKTLELCKEAGARQAIKLPVSGAFHSKLMIPAQNKLNQHIDTISFKKPTSPIICNTNKMVTSNPNILKEELKNQLCNCVNWQNSIEIAVNQGIESFVEIGPGKVLRNLFKRDYPSLNVLSLNNVETIKKTTFI